jgi:hypothetical protein
MCSDMLAHDAVLLGELFLMFQRITVPSYPTVRKSVKNEESLSTAWPLKMKDYIPLKHQIKSSMKHLHSS